MTAPSTLERSPSLGAAAIGGAAVMMAYHVASRATRDTLFITSFGVPLLPLVVAATSVLSIGAAIYSARVMSRIGPGRLMSAAFLASAALTLVEWAIVTRQPAAGAILVFLHVAVLSPVLVSGFWSLVNESLDPRTTRMAIGHVAGFATIGGVAGGLLAERISTWAGVSSTLPFLALAHLACAWSTRRMPGATESRRRDEPRSDGTPASEGMLLLLRFPHVRNLGLIVLGCSVSETLLDYAFKATATEAVAHGSLGLMRVFLGFNAAVALGTFAVQMLFSRLVRGPRDLVRAIGVLPGTIALGGTMAAILPGPWTISLLRGFEAVLHGSVFRAGYDILQASLPQAQRRATRALIDVGCDRLGDVLGAGLVALVLVSTPIGTVPLLLGIGIVTAVMTLGFVAQLHRGHIQSLVDSLKVRTDDRDPTQVGDWIAHSSVQFAMGSEGVAEHESARAAAEPPPPPVRSRERPPLDLPSVHEKLAAGPARSEEVPHEESDWSEGSERPAAPDPDRVAASLVALLSRDPERVRATLRAERPLDPTLVPPAIRLLEMEEIERETVEALIAVAPRHVGQLADALLDATTPPAMKRRITLVLATCPTVRTVEDLTRGLADDLFEVRHACGRALVRLHERDTALSPDREVLYAAIRREAVFSRPAWESHRALTRRTGSRESSALDQFMRDRAGRSLEHVFTLLSLALPGENVQVAFRALQTSDRMLHGTALEYLEGVLPPDVREPLWPILEPEGTRPASPGRPRDRTRLLQDLLDAVKFIERFGHPPPRREPGTDPEPPGGDGRPSKPD
jgi:ATP/ADP translocase